METSTIITLAVIALLLIYFIGLYNALVNIKHNVANMYTNTNI